MNNPMNREVVDSRDIIEYFEHLTQVVIDEHNEILSNDTDNEDYEEIDTICEIDDEQILLTETGAEYIQFRDEINECEGYISDWEYGAGLIHERYFQEYCEQELVDCGYLPDNLPHWIEIDMEATAENMKQDYSEYEFDGEIYYAR